MEASRNFLEFTTKASDSANALQQGGVHHRHHGKKKHVSGGGSWLLGCKPFSRKMGYIKPPKKKGSGFFVRIKVREFLMAPNLKATNIHDPVAGSTHQFNDPSSCITRTSWEGKYTSCDSGKKYTIASCLPDVLPTKRGWGHVPQHWQVVFNCLLFHAQRFFHSLKDDL